VGRRQQQAGAALRELHQLARLVQRHGHGLLHQHVLAGLQRGLGHGAVRRHRRRHHHQVNVVGLDDTAVVGVEGDGAEALLNERALCLVHVAGARHLHGHAGGLHAPHLVGVGAQHHAAAAHEAYSNCHRFLHTFLRFRTAKDCKP
jgi:hypothetical protein